MLLSIFTLLYLLIGLLEMCAHVLKVQNLKEKQEKARKEAVVDSEQAIIELSHRHEREKQMLREDNQKLTTHVEFVSSIMKKKT